MEDLPEDALQDFLAKEHLYLADLIALMPGQIPDPGDPGHGYEATSDYIRWRRRDEDIERGAATGLVGAEELAALDEAHRELTLKLPCTHTELVAWVARTGGDFVLPANYAATVRKLLETETLESEAAVPAVAPPKVIREDFLSCEEAEQLLGIVFLGLTREEIAMWIWCGSVENLGLKQSALPAFADPYQTEEPRPFVLVEVVKDDSEPWSFAWQLDECFFKRSDIEGFSPSDRWLPFDRLRARWNDQIPPETKLEDFIIERVRDATILPWHPYTRLTLPLLDTEGIRVSREEILHGTRKWPGLRHAMFRLAEVKAVEAQYGWQIPRKKRIPPGAEPGMLHVDDAVDRIIKTIFPPQTSTADDAFAAGWDKAQWKRRLVEAIRKGVVSAYDSDTLLRVRLSEPGRDTANLLVRWTDVQAWIRGESAVHIPSEERDGNARPVPPGADPLRYFREMKKLLADEVSIAFLAHNRLEVTARGITQRVPLAAIGLIDGRTGDLNRQAKILLGFAKFRLLPSDKQGTRAKSISRLREIFKKHLGITSDPFDYRDDGRWEARFTVKDKRAAAEERAERKARHVPVEAIDRAGAAEWPNENAADRPDDEKEP